MNSHNKAPTPEQIEQNNQARAAIYKDQSEMRTKIEKVTCDLCAKTANVTTPGTDPNEWVGFWYVDPRGMGDVEYQVCDGCAKSISARYAEIHAPKNDE